MEGMRVNACLFTLVGEDPHFLSGGLSRERDLNCFFTADRSRKAALKLPGSGKQQMVLSVDIRNREKRSLRLSKNRYYHAPETKIVCR